MTRDIMSATQDIIRSSSDIDALLFHLRIEKNMTEREISSALGIRKKEVASRLGVLYGKIREKVQ